MNGADCVHERHAQVPIAEMRPRARVLPEDVRRASRGTPKRSAAHRESGSPLVAASIAVAVSRSMSGWTAVVARATTAARELRQRPLEVRARPVLDLKLFVDSTKVVA